MARNPSRVPSYRLHKASGQAVVTLSGHDHYLGPYGTPASRARYDLLTGQWQSRGRTPAPADPADGGITVSQLILSYWRHAEQHYVHKDGTPTSQLDLIRTALKALREAHGATLASKFGPSALIVVRDRLVASGLARETINSHIGRIRRAFRWATERELIPPSVWYGLQSVRGLQAGRTSAPDHPPVEPVPDEHVAAVLARVRAPIAAMIVLQELTAMRPGEVVLMRGGDIDRSGTVWKYVPHSHKTQHLGRSRVILLGPRAVAVLTPFLRDDPQAYLFQPRSSRSTRRGRRGYSVPIYRKQIARACRKSNIPPWSPNRLRHTAATRIRHEFGLEVAQVILGHKHANVTEIYAERDVAKAVERHGTDRLIRIRRGDDPVPRFAHEDDRALYATVAHWRIIAALAEATPHLTRDEHSRLAACSAFLVKAIYFENWSLDAYPLIELRCDIDGLFPRGERLHALLATAWHTVDGVETAIVARRIPGDDPGPIIPRVLNCGAVIRTRRTLDPADRQDDPLAPPSSDSLAPPSSDPLAATLKLLGRERRFVKIVRFLATQPGRGASFDQIAVGAYQADPAHAHERKETIRRECRRIREILEEGGAPLRLKRDEESARLVDAQ